MRWRALPAGSIPLVPPGIRIDDLAHEPMTNDVSAREIGEMDIVDIGEDLAHDLQAATGIAW